MSLETHFKNPDWLEVGIDEAGRGCLFSRVYAGAVYWDPQVKSSLIKDSKKLDHRKRLMAYDFIKENCFAYAYGYAEAEEIDRINILQATLNCFHRALDGCSVVPQHILVDGTHFKYYHDQDGMPINYTTVIGGDDKYYSIASASIVAKVERDLYVEKLCDQDGDLDLYDIRSNKGYGAKKHLEGLEQYGLTQYHRRTFCKRFV